MYHQWHHVKTWIRLTLKILLFERPAATTCRIHGIHSSLLLLSNYRLYKLYDLECREVLLLDSSTITYLLYNVDNSLSISYDIITIDSVNTKAFYRIYLELHSALTIHLHRLQIFTLICQCNNFIESTYNIKKFYIYIIFILIILK